LFRAAFIAKKRISSIEFFEYAEVTSTPLAEFVPFSDQIKTDLLKLFHDCQSSEVRPS
jgi:hypothetical protein